MVFDWTHEYTYWYSINQLQQSTTQQSTTPRNRTNQNKTKSAPSPPSGVSGPGGARMGGHGGVTWRVDFERDADSRHLYVYAVSLSRTHMLYPIRELCPFADFKSCSRNLCRVAKFLFGT